MILGSQFPITWAPNDSNGVSLSLGQVVSGVVQLVATIVSDAPNTGVWISYGD
jgi:hypothetical protein